VQSFILTEVSDYGLLIVVNFFFWGCVFCFCVCVCVCISVSMFVRIWQFHVCRPRIRLSIQNQILDMTIK